MCGNCVAIGIAVVITHQAHQPILLVLLLALTACIVVVAGTTLRGTVECRIATTTLRATAPTMSASGWYVKIYRSGHSLNS